jgi:sugar phosphate permease
MSSLSSFRAIFGWSLIALFFCYQYLLRVTPGVISQELRQAFLMTAEEFSSLGAYYLYAYALLQIPIGFLVDRIGVKRTILGSLFLCLLGTLWITQTTSLLQAQMSRVLVGAGSACAFMGALKWVADHFAPGNRGFLMGATLTLGTFGALSAGRPLVSLVDQIGWQKAVIGTGLLGIVLWFFILFFLKDTNTTKDTAAHAKGPVQLSHVLADLKEIACNKNIVVYALLAIGVYTPLAILADLWGVSFLVEKFAIKRADAASTTMLMYVGLAAGSLTLPTFAEKYNWLSRIIQLCSIGLLIVFLVLLFSPDITPVVLQVLFFTIGCLCGAEMVCFSGALVGCNPRTSGLTIGFVNTMNMLGGAILQQIIGYALDRQWSGAVDAMGVRLYNSHQYTKALTILPLILVGCVILSLTLRRGKEAKTLSS